MNPLYLLPFVFTITFADLVLYEAGANPIAKGSISGSTICPKDYANGINIKCTNLPGSLYANFTVDGVQVRKENSRPYYIAGDKIASGFVNSWSAPLGKTVIISCIGSNGISHKAKATFSCRPKPDPTPMFDDLKPSTMVFVEAGRNGEIGPVLKDGLTFCPDTFSSGKYSIFCKDGPNAIKGWFFINGARVNSDGTVPYHINRDFRGRVNSWVAPKGYFNAECRIGRGIRSKARVRVFCGPSPKRTPEPKPEPTMKGTPKPGNPMEKTKRDGCILIDARLSALSAGWQKTRKGVIFRKGNPSKGIAKAGDFPLEYKFTPPVTSHYAVVVDMTTMDSKDYNDVWIKVDGDFNLIKRGVVNEGKGKGWTKGYHNKDGRAAIVSSVDFNAHSISTKLILKKGVEYKFGIAGRSNQVEVHRIILFPCGQGKSKCQRGDQSWKDFMVSCAGVTNPSG